MRRSALWGGIFKFVFWAAILIAPLWFYMAYLAPVVNDMTKTVQQIQGTSAKAQMQLSGFQEMLKQLQQKIPSIGQ